MLRVLLLAEISAREQLLQQDQLKKPTGGVRVSELMAECAAHKPKQGWGVERGRGAHFCAVCSSRPHDRLGQLQVCLDIVAGHGKLRGCDPDPRHAGQRALYALTIVARWSALEWMAATE